VTSAGWRAALLALGSAGWAVSGCTVPLAAELDGHDANRIVAALDASGIVSAREAEPGVSGRYRIEIARADSVRAVAVLGELGLPRAAVTDREANLEQGALVPSRAAERARLLRATAAEVERTVEDVDGVLTARVHLAAPGKDPLSPEPPPTARASVLVRYRGSTSPLTAADVQRLVAGAVPGLLPAEVAVVQTAVAERSTGPELVRVGPFVTPRPMAGLLRVTLAAALLLNVALVAAAGLLYRRARRSRVAR